MDNDCPIGARCALCNDELPRGVRVAFFTSPDTEQPVLGDFCSVAHALFALEELANAAVLPDTLFLGVRVDQTDYDETALATILSEIARRAGLASLAPDETNAPSLPPHRLN